MCFKKRNEKRSMKQTRRGGGKRGNSFKVVKGKMDMEDRPMSEGDVNGGLRACLDRGCVQQAPRPPFG